MVLDLSVRIVGTGPTPTPTPVGTPTPTPVPTPSPTPTPVPTNLVQFSAATFRDDESQSVIVTVTRTGATTGASTVTLSTGGGTATGGTCTPGGAADYQTTTTTLTFAAGSTTPQTVSIPLCPDTRIDFNETFNVTLSAPNSVTGVGTQATAVVTINDTANQFRNPTPIAINSGEPATPYPSTITVAGATNNVFRPRVTLYDFYHSFPDNVDVLLVGPNGAKYVLMADVGGPVPIPQSGAVTLTFADFAPTTLPDAGPLVTGQFKPTTCETPVTNFSAPAPAGPYIEPGCTVARPNAQTLFGAFGGSNGNGVWSLYVRDDAGVPRALAPEVVLGEIQGGWGLELLPSTAAGVEVSGRILTPDGRGLRNATVTITDSLGVQRTATTSSFGHYRFEDVEVGSTLVMSVTSNRYRYTPRVVQVFDTLADVDFTGQL